MGTFSVVEIDGQLLARQRLETDRFGLSSPLLVDLTCRLRHPALLSGRFDPNGPALFLPLAEFRLRSLLSSPSFSSRNRLLLLSSVISALLYLHERGILCGSLSVDSVVLVGSSRGPLPLLFLSSASLSRDFSADVLAFALLARETLPSLFDSPLLLSALSPHPSLRPSARAISVLFPSPEERPASPLPSAGRPILPSNFRELLKLLLRWAHAAFSDQPAAILFLAVDLCYRSGPLFDKKEAAALQVSAAGCLWLAFKMLGRGERGAAFRSLSEAVERFCPKVLTVQSLVQAELCTVTFLEGVLYRPYLYAFCPPDVLADAVRILYQPNLYCDRESWGHSLGIVEGEREALDLLSPEQPPLTIGQILSF